MIDQFVNGMTGYLQDASLLAFLAAYLGGILISFTPCVYPVIPITVASICSHGRVSKKKSFVFSLVYVLGVSLTYSGLGAFAALQGKLFGQIQTNPWTYVIVANIFIFMALSMLGIFVLPVRTPDFLTRVKPRKKGIFSIFFVGAVSGLIMGPCTVPVFAALLGYVATTQNILLGMGLLFTFAFGIGTPLILLGTFTSMLTSMPKSGAWMIAVNHISGWILLAMGEYFLIKAGGFWI